MKKFYPTILKSEKVVISIRTDNNKLEKIDDIANKIKISRNDLINQCLDYALDNVTFSPLNEQVTKLSDADLKEINGKQ